MKRPTLFLAIAFNLAMLMLAGCGTTPSPPAGSGTPANPNRTAAPGGGTGGAPPTANPAAAYRKGFARLQVRGGVSASYSLRSVDAPHALTVPTPPGSGLVWEDPAGDQLQISWGSDVPASGVTHRRKLVVYLAMAPGHELVEATSVAGECRVTVRHADASSLTGGFTCGGLLTDFRSTVQVHGAFSASA